MCVHVHKCACVIEIVVWLIEKVLWQSLLIAHPIYIFPFFFCNVTLILLKAAMLPVELHYIGFLKARCVHWSKFRQWDNHKCGVWITERILTGNWCRLGCIALLLFLLFLLAGIQTGWLKVWQSPWTTRRSKGWKPVQGKYSKMQKASLQSFLLALTCKRHKYLSCLSHCYFVLIQS